MRRVALGLLLLAACRTGGTHRPKPVGAEPTGNATGSTQGETPAPGERCPGGTPWNGLPTGCTYEVGGCCYDNAERACAASTCKPDACEVLETSPAQVRCRDA